MTRDEFEHSYAQRGEMTVEWLRSMGLYAVPCDCQEDGCRGWQMRNLANLLVPSVHFPTEHIPDGWDGQELLDDLIAEGNTELVFALRRALEENQEK